VSHDNSYAYINGGNYNGTIYSLSKVDISTGNLVSSLTLTGIAPIGSMKRFALSANGNTLYLPVGSGGNVLKVDTASMTLSSTITTPNNNTQVTTLSPDGNTVLVGNSMFPPGFHNTIVVGTNTAGTSYAFDNTYGQSSNPDVLAGGTANALYATENNPNNSPGTIGVWTLGTYSPQVAHITVGGNPFQMALTNDGAHLAVTNSYDGTVSVIATANNTVIKTITMPGGVVGICTQPPPIAAPPVTPKYPGATFIPKLFIPIKGKRTVDYTHDELMANWLAIENWSTRWLPPAPVLFFPYKGRSDREGINANWITLEAWANQIRGYGAPYVPVFVPRKNSIKPVDLDINFLAVQNWANLI
jgi:YVTN family beta-propeller protein